MNSVLGITFKCGTGCPGGLWLVSRSLLPGQTDSTRDDLIFLINLLKGKAGFRILQAHAHSLQSFLMLGGFGPGFQSSAENGEST